MTSSRKRLIGFSPELFPGNESETEKIDELEVLREEMRSQFEKYQAEMSNLHAEIARLSAKLKRWRLRWLLAQQKFLPLLRKRFSNPKLFFRWTLLILILLQDLSEGNYWENSIVWAKTHRYVLIDGRKEFLPDLVEQIIRDHIVPVMENETQEEKTKRLNGYMELKGKKIDGLTFGELSALRRGLRTLDSMVIVDISKELMKLI